MTVTRPRTLHRITYIQPHDNNNNDNDNDDNGRLPAHRLMVVQSVRSG